MPGHLEDVPGGEPREDAPRLLDLGFREPEFRDRLLASGATPYTLPPAEFMSLLRAELPMWADIVKRSGATVD